MKKDDCNAGKWIEKHVTVFHIILQMNSKVVKLPMMSAIFVKYSVEYLVEDLRTN